MGAAETRRVIAAGAVGNVLEWYDFNENSRAVLQMA